MSHVQTEEQPPSTATTADGTSAIDVVGRSHAVAPRWPPAGVVVAVMLTVSVMMVAVAPALMPASYSWTRRSISETAAQGIDRAWVARSGLLLFALAVIWLSGLRQAAWGPTGRVLHLGFGVSMLGVAVFATRPWDVTAPYVWSEDLLHTVSAAAAGLTFIAGAASVLVARRQRSGSSSGIDLIAAILPLPLLVGMATIAPLYGAFQRLLFVVT